jgi:PH domain
VFRAHTQLSLLCGIDAGRRKNWNARYFELRPGFLSYQKEKDDGKVLGVIPLTEIGLDDSSRRVFCWTISTPTRTFFLEAASLDEKNTWMELIEEHRT